MTDEETALVDAAWFKFRRREPMSKADLERLLAVFQSNDLNVEVLQMPDVGALKLKVTETFNKYAPKPQ